MFLDKDGYEGSADYIPEMHDGIGQARFLDKIIWRASPAINTNEKIYYEEGCGCQL